MAWLRSKQHVSAAYNPIVFFVRLDEVDWDEAIGAWRCPALRLPSAEAREMRHHGSRIDSDKYKIDIGAHLIIWNGGAQERPSSMSIRLEIPARLLTIDQVKKKKEEDTLSIAKRITSISLAVLIVSALVAAIAGYRRGIEGGPLRTGSEVAADSRREHGVSAGTIAPLPVDVRAAFPKPVCSQELATERYVRCGYSTFEECVRDITAPETYHCAPRPQPVDCLFYGVPRLLACYPSRELCASARIAFAGGPCVHFDIAY